MGGDGGYDRDVTEVSSTRESFNFTQDRVRENPAILREKKISEHFDPKKAMRNGWECKDFPEQGTKIIPIVWEMDLTLSRGKDITTMFDKLPLLMGKIVMENYVPGHVPQVSISGVGDVRYDRFPVQISDFESDLRIDRNMKAIEIEEGGGGNGVESYATTTYGYARHSFLDASARGKKGYMFILGDEGFYPVVTKEEIKRIYGIEEKKDIPAAQIFQEAQEKYHVFFIYVLKSWEKRKEGIDAEIKKRVKERGGMYENVSVRGSLIWNTCDDLDLHCVAPSGEEIYFSHMKSQCGGELDVDTNAGGCRTRKAVENIRWKKGRAPKGRYKFFVRNFAYHDPDNRGQAVPFSLELCIDGRIEHFEGSTPKDVTGRSSDVVCFEFDYDPDESRAIQEGPTDPYALYKDDVVLDQWREVLPEEHILVINNPKAIVDVMIGAIALKEQQRTLDEYDRDMKKRDQTDTRRNEVRGALENLSLSGTAKKVETSKLPKKKK